MHKNNLLRKGLVVGIILLLIGMNVVPSYGKIDVAVSKTTIYDGSLSGYVNDTFMDPVEGVRVRVYFHGTYEEDYSDSTGHYHVTNIPICWCVKNCTASKEGYTTEWVWLAIYEDTTCDFVLTPITQYDGSLSGYVNDTSMNPVEGARVRVYFHEAYEEDYSDSTGYYHVTNIPICYCLKNATCSKNGYKTEWVLLGIVEDTTYDFILTSINHPPNKPFIDGKWVIYRVEIECYFRAIDPDEDNVKYHMDWGDGNTDLTDFYKSGEEITVGHTYSHQGTYTITVYAEDTGGLVGPASQYWPRNKAVTNPLFYRLFERFPILQKILCYIL